MKRRLVWLVLLTLLLTGWLCTAQGEAAEDLTKQVTVTAGGKTTKPRKMRDGKYTTYYSLKKGGVLEFACEGKTLGGLKLQFYDHAAAGTVEAYTGDSWTTCGTVGDYLSDYVSVPEGTTIIRLTNTSSGRMYLAEFKVYGEGDEPEDAPHWVQADKADMMLVVCHPDDELLWFGGLLPTYAGEKGLTVQVVYVVPSTPNRRLELLDGLQKCGVTAYPSFVGMQDARSKTLEGQYKHWNKNNLLKKLTALIRAYQPEVLITQDFHGEYGHGGHRATADAAVKAAAYAPKADKYKESAKEYGVWQVKKVYVHLYEERQIQLDWHQPLTAFDGKDGLTVATEALQCHVSQTKHWQMEDGGENDNSLFGLYDTTVGEDVLGNDFMENIPGYDTDTDDLLDDDADGLGGSHDL